MLRSDADSGRSSCSAGSAPEGGRPVRGPPPRRHTREASTNTDDPPNLPVYVPTRQNKTLSHQRSYPIRPQLSASVFDLNSPQPTNVTPRKGGLTNAFSSIDILSSIQNDLRRQMQNIPLGYDHRAKHFQSADQNLVQPHGLFERNGPVDDRLLKRDQNLKRVGASRLRVRRQPLQRAASRLYRAVSPAEKDDGCVGPEFIVRASHPSKQLDITTTMPSVDKRTVVVVLLNGQKIDVACDPQSTTAAQVFQAVVQKERLEHNFMLGLSALVGGDFVFLPDEYKIKKVAPDLWSCTGTYKKKLSRAFNSATCHNSSFTLFLRIKFFMPPNLSKAVRGGTWGSWVYLQLRRSVVEGQITLQLPQLVQLAGYALQVEFGNYSSREHASGHYYMMEHYFPEGSFTDNDIEIRLLVKQAHEAHKNMSLDEAREKFISIAQTYRDYGSHFYTAVWATRDGFTRDVWLSISPRGMILYSRNACITALPRENTSSRILLQSLAWQYIHTLCYNKHTLYVIPNDRVGAGKSGLKLKLKMESNKSYFTFWLASLHHRFYMRLHADINSLLNISDEFSIPIDRDGKQDEIFNLSQTSPKNDAKDNEKWLNECSNFQDSYNIAVRGNVDQIVRNIQDYNRGLEEFQNKENEKPSMSKESSRSPQLYQKPMSVDTLNASGSELLSSPESCSLPRRMGVKMGTRAFNGSQQIGHKQFHSLDATHLGMSPSFTDQINRLTFSPDRLVHSDIELASTMSDSDDPISESKTLKCNVNRMNILPERNYICEPNNSSSIANSAYVIDSPQVTNNTFLYRPQNDETLMNNSLQERLTSMGCVQSERRFRTIHLMRDANGALGMQVAEGSDGNVYVKSITPGGSAAQTKHIYPGDQIISVNGQTLLNLNYNKALSYLQNAPKQVEIILLQAIPVNESRKNTTLQYNRELMRKHSLSNDKSNNMVARLLNGNSFSKLSLYSDGRQHEEQSNVANLGRNIKESTTIESCPSGLNEKVDTINVETLKTINVLLALTKHNLEKKTSINDSYKVDSVIRSNSISYDKMNDAYIYPSSTESTPSKRPLKNKNHSFSMSQENKSYKRRPLSVHIPANVDLFGSPDDSNSIFDDNLKLRTLSCDNITVLKALNKSFPNLDSNKLTPVKKSVTLSSECMEKPSMGIYNKQNPISRKWIGHVKYPVTPSKIALNQLKKPTDISNPHHSTNFANLPSDDEQIFI